MTSWITGGDKKTSTLSFQSFVSKANNNPPALKWNKTEDSSLSGDYPYWMCLHIKWGSFSHLLFSTFGALWIYRILQYLFLNVEWTLATLLENCKYDQKHQAPCHMEYDMFEFRPVWYCILALFTLHCISLFPYSVYWFSAKVVNSLLRRTNWPGWSRLTKK